MSPMPESTTPVTSTTLELVDKLKSEIVGNIVLPTDKKYQLILEDCFNFSYTAIPQIIVQPKTTRDVAAAVKYAKEAKLTISVAGGRHSVRCWGPGLAIDLSLMRGTVVDPVKKTALVFGGTKLGEMDNECERFGLCVTAGTNSDTGVAGLTLGGGWGYIAKSRGLSIDSIISVEMVLPDGRIINASEEENSDIFWAIRGAGANFGVVTRFLFRLQPIPSVIISGNIVHHFSNLKTIGKKFFEFNKTSPRQLDCNLMIAPGGPDSHGVPTGPVCIVFPTYLGESKEEAESLLDTIRSWCPPIADTTGPKKYTELQKQLDPLAQPGFWYERAIFISKKADFDDILDILSEEIKKLPSYHGGFMGFLDFSGAIGDVPQDATAFGHRDAAYWFAALQTYSGPNKKEEAGFIDHIYQRIKKYTVGIYANETIPTGTASDYYGPNVKKLLELKKKYDPDNLIIGSLSKFQN